MRRRVLLVAVFVLLAPARSQAGKAPIEYRCFSAGAKVAQDPKLDGLMRAEGKLVKVNPRELARSYLSPTTLQFLLQRECSRIQLGHLEGRVTATMHEEADCRALDALVDERYRRDSDGAARAKKTIERDFELLEPEDWPPTMGRLRRLDLKSCR